jgi:hypothetical protein
LESNEKLSKKKIGGRKDFKDFISKKEMEIMFFKDDNTCAGVTFRFDIQV